MDKNINEKNELKKGLCFRCEYRAIFLETGIQPRCECGMTNMCKFACYMYIPVKPVILQPLNKDDKRPRFCGALSSRERFVGVLKKGELKLTMINKTDACLYWIPKKEKKMNDNQGYILIIAIILITVGCFLINLKSHEHEITMKKLEYEYLLKGK